MAGFWENLMGSQAQAAEPSQYKVPMKPNYTGGGPAYVPDTEHPDYRRPGSPFTNAQRKNMDKTFALDERGLWERLLDFVGAGKEKGKAQAK